MCGIFGLISKTSLVTSYFTKLDDVIEQMFIATSLRGNDSAGMFVVDDVKGTVKVLKRAVPIHDFVNDRIYNKFSKKVFTDSKYIVGHTRAATSGTISMDNAHPFINKHITFVHNGNVSNANDLIKSNNHPPFEVDSQHIGEALANNCVEDAIALLQGAFAIVWHDSKEDTLNIIRNTGRPLHFIPTDSKIVFGSERGMLAWILSRNGHQLDLSKLEEYKENVWYKYYNNDKIIDVETKKLSFKDSTVYYGNFGFHNGYTYYNHNNNQYSTFQEKLGKPNLDPNKEIPVYLIDYKKFSHSSENGRITGVFCAAQDKEYDVEMFPINEKFQQFNNFIESQQLKYPEFGNSPAFFFKPAREAKNYTTQSWDIICNPDYVIGVVYKPNKIVRYAFDNKSGQFSKSETIKVSNTNTGTLMLPGPNNTFVDENEFNKLTKSGCSACTGDLLPENATDITWIDSQTPICRNCFINTQQDEFVV